MLGTSSSQAAKLTGGSMNKNISQSNLPNIKLKVDPFNISVTKPELFGRDDRGSINSKGSLYSGTSDRIGAIGYTVGRANNVSGALGEISSGNASPQTSALGSGQALDITPAYYTAHMWLRTS